MAAAASRGAFIVLEGVDRVGKSTQAALLEDALNRAGVMTTAINFPRRSTPIGQLIDAHLRTGDGDISGHAMHLLYSANRWECVGEIKELMARGVTVICDRYALSGYAYSVATGLDPEWCRAADLGLVAPDCTLYLGGDAVASVASRRSGWGAERYEVADFQHKVSAIYDEMVATDDTCVVVDATLGVQAIHAIALAECVRVVADVGDAPLRFLA